MIAAPHAQEEVVLRARVAADLAASVGVARDVWGARLDALVLTGGYARGEGGALGDGPWAPAFNDYDLVAVVRSWRPSDLARAREVSRRATEAIDRGGAPPVEVDVWPVSRATIDAPPPTLFWLDVGRSAVVLLGDRSVLCGSRAITTRDVPLDEASRLLANRATGLALSRLQQDPVRDPLRAAKHVYKAFLACGDARLLAADVYAPTLRERLVQLDELARHELADRALVDAYRAAIVFRGRPDQWCQPTEMARWFNTAVGAIAGWHVGFEAWRRADASLTVTELVHDDTPIFDRRVDASRWGHLAAIRAAIGNAAPLLPLLGHPRERLARASMALAYLPPAEGLSEAALLLLGARGAPITREIAVERLVRLRSVGA